MVHHLGHLLHQDQFPLLLLTCLLGGEKLVPPALYLPEKRGVLTAASRHYSVTLPLQSSKAPRLGGMRGPWWATAYSRDGHLLHVESASSPQWPAWQSIHLSCTGERKGPLACQVWHMGIRGPQARGGFPAAHTSWSNRHSISHAQHSPHYGPGSSQGSQWTCKSHSRAVSRDPRHSPGLHLKWLQGRKGTFWFIWSSLLPCQEEQKGRQ